MATGESAGDIFEQLAKQYGKPGEPDYHNNLGLAHRARGEWDAAIREYRVAISLKPHDVMFHCNLASALSDKGEHQEALSEYEQALQLSPHDYNTHYNLGNLLSKLGRMPEAIAEYERAIQVDPERADAHYNLANRLWEQDRPGDAASHYERALAAAPSAPIAGEVRARLASFYIDEKAWGKAEQHLLELAGSEPGNFIAHYGLGIVYLNMEPDERPRSVLYGEAVIHAQKALEIDPQDEDAGGLARAALEAYDAESLGTNPAGAD